MNEICRLETEIAELKSLLFTKEEELRKVKGSKQSNNVAGRQDLSCSDIVKFSRQIILPQMGRAGQLKLKEARVLVVGVGGLGCPVLLYLANAGVGHLTIVDADTVEASNLHRQTLHSDETIGLSKVQSALNFFKRYQSYTTVEAITERFTPLNASTLISTHNIIVDATDNAGTRYLINDECVKHSRPLVSGSALGLEGQVTVYNAKIKRGGTILQGPCYRCLFPNPPPTDSTTSCSQNGVLGPVPGLIGLIQSIETIKLIVDWPGCETLAGRMILLDASDLTLRTVKLRLANENCPACGKSAENKLPYYSDLCGDACSSLRLLEPESRISPEQVNLEKQNLVLLDVRSKGEFGMCHIESSLNFPINSLADCVDDINKLVLQRLQTQPQLKVCCICRRGNDSQLAVMKLRQHLTPEVQVVDMTGGLHNWARNVDSNFPVY